MKKQYVPTTLSSFLIESKSITLKRGYGERDPIVVSANAPLRTQVLSFVAESKKVSKGELKQFIAGLNETSKNPGAAANMWIKRNSKFFVAESKNGETFYKLSSIGKRLANLAPTGISESENREVRNKLDEMIPGRFDEPNSDFEEDEEVSGKYDFLGKAKGIETIFKIVDGNNKNAYQD